MCKVCSFQFYALAGNPASFTSVYIYETGFAKLSLMAHFTHSASFEHNYMILHPILIF